MVVYGNGTTGSGIGESMKVIVTAAPSGYAGGTAGVARTCNITVAPYTAGGLTTSASPAGKFDGKPTTTADGSAVAVFVYGAAWQKGSDTDGLASIEPDFTQYSNSPIIIRDKFEINGSTDRDWETAP